MAKTEIDLGLAEMKAEWLKTLFTLGSMAATAVLFLGFMALTLAVGAGLDALFATFPADAWVKFAAKVAKGGLYLMELVALLYAVGTQFVRHFSTHKK